MAYKPKSGRKWRNQGQSAETFTSNREAIVKQLYADLDEWEKRTAPERIAELIAAWGDKYQGKNPKLIAMQDPHATDVDAHGAWRERGRTNIGSDVGIKIVNPQFYDICKTCQEKEKHPGHQPGGHKFDPVIKYFYSVIYDIRHTIPDTAAARTAWKNDHPEDELKRRYWNDDDDYKDYEKYGAVL